METSAINMVEVAPRIWVAEDERESGLVALLKYWVKSIIVILVK